MSSPTQHAPYGTTERDRKFRARRVRIAFYTLYRGVHAWLEAGNKQAQGRALDSIIRAHRDLQSHGVALEDRGEEEVGP